MITAKLHNFYIHNTLRGLVLTLIAVFQEMANDVNESAFVPVGPVWGTFHEQAPVRIALRRVRRVSVFDLSEIVQESGKLCRTKR